MPAKMESDSRPSRRTRPMRQRRNGSTRNSAATGELEPDPWHVADDDGSPMADFPVMPRRTTPRSGSEERSDAILTPALPAGSRRGSRGSARASAMASAGASIAGFSLADTPSEVGGRGGVYDSKVVDRAVRFGVSAKDASVSSAPFPLVDAETGEAVTLNTKPPESPRTVWKREARAREAAQRQKWSFMTVPPPMGERAPVRTAADVQEMRRQNDLALHQLVEFEMLREEKRLEELTKEMDPLKRRWAQRSLDIERKEARRHIIGVAHDMEFVVAQKMAELGFLR